MNQSVRNQFVSIVVDDSFPQNKVPVHVPWVKMLYTLGSDQGLFCFYGDNYQMGRDGPNSLKGKAVLWNPSIKKTVVIVEPNVGYATNLGFGVCRKTNDPKIVKFETSIKTESISCIRWQIFTLSTRVWRNSYSNLPCKSFVFGSYQVVLDGFIYWLAFESILTNGRSRSRLVISFDLTSEEFREVDIPDTLASMPYFDLSIFKLRESLVVLEAANGPVMSLWMMEDGVSKSFTKLFTFDVNTPVGSIREYRKILEPKREVIEDDFPVCKLVFYHQFNREYYDNFGIDGSVFSYYPYMESLLLVGQPDLIVHNEMETLKSQDDLSSEEFQLVI